MHPRTFATCAALIAAGCGSPALMPDGGAAPAAPAAPPIAAEQARAPKEAPQSDAPDPRSPSRPMAYVEGEVITYREILQRHGPEIAQLESAADKARMEDRALIDLLRE